MDYYNLDKNETILVSLKAIIIKNGKMLVLQCPHHDNKLWSGKWGLPGGLLEIDEEVESGLKREIKEETGLEIVIDKPFGIDGNFRYDDFLFADGRKLNVRFIEIGFVCKYEGGEVVISEEHQACKWATQEEIKKLKFTPDSQGLVDKYVRG